MADETYHLGATTEPGPAPAGGGAGGGARRARPPCLPGAVPPPSVPLSFLAAASIGLVACGAAWAWAGPSATVDPTADPVVAAVHLGVLATLATGVLGAAHQFTPVITGRPLRSVRLARATFATWLATSWLLPLGVATGQVVMTALSGALAGVAVLLLATNLGPALSVRGKGTPVTALRSGVAGAVATGFLGAAFVGDRQGNWFTLAGNVDLAMGVLGLFGWLGITYIGVAEKLWPMFMLAHVAGRRLSDRVAVWGSGVGVALCAPGLAWGLRGITWAGGSILGVALASHIASLVVHLRHRRRPADLHLVFVTTSAAWIPVGAGLALAGASEVRVHHHLGVALAAAAMVAFGSWLLEALVGHAHKVVPFIAWSALRARGVATGPTGKPLMFADLYDRPPVGCSLLRDGHLRSVRPLLRTGRVFVALDRSGGRTAGPYRLDPRREPLVGPDPHVGLGGPGAGGRAVVRARSHGSCGETGDRSGTRLRRPAAVVRLHFLAGS